MQSIFIGTNALGQSAHRLDSLLMMNSLLQKESMAGQLQMIYIDLPYGIKYGSDFLPFATCQAA